MIQTICADVLDIIERLRKQYDESCKKILSNKTILAHIMKESLKEYESLSIPEIISCIEPEANEESIIGLPTEDITVSGAKTVYDLLYCAALPNKEEDIGIMINLEAQDLSRNPGYPLVKRLMYYLARHLVRQKTGRYRKLRKVVCIFICMNAPKKSQNSINGYRMEEIAIRGELHEKEEDYDLMEGMIIRLKEKVEDGRKDMMNLLSSLFSLEESAEEKKEKLEKGYGILMTRKMEKEVKEMCNFSQGVYSRGIKEGIEQGIGQGIKQGIKQGTELGMIEGLSRSTMALMEKMKIDIEEAMIFLNIEETLRPSIKEKLEYNN